MDTRSEPSRSKTTTKPSRLRSSNSKLGEMWLTTPVGSTRVGSKLPVALSPRTLRWTSSNLPRTAVRNMDVLTAEQRHKAMANNRGRTRPERILASLLWSRGLRYLTFRGYRSLTGRRLTGSPDLVFSRQKVVVFVDGCFWHGCQQCNKSANLRDAFWTNKIRATRIRDHRVTTELQSDGWGVLRIPEHDLRNKTSREATVDRVALFVSTHSETKLPLRHDLAPEIAQSGDRACRSLQ